MPGSRRARVFPSIHARYRRPRGVSEPPDEFEQTCCEDPAVAHQLVVSGRRNGKGALHFVLNAFL